MEKYEEILEFIHIDPKPQKLPPEPKFKPTINISPKDRYIFFLHTPLANSHTTGVENIDFRLGVTHDMVQKLAQMRMMNPDIKSYIVLERDDCADQLQRIKEKLKNKETSYQWYNISYRDLNIAINDLGLQGSIVNIG